MLNAWSSRESSQECPRWPQEARDYIQRPLRDNAIVQLEGRLPHQRRQTCRLILDLTPASVHEPKELRLFCLKIRVTR